MVRPERCPRCDGNRWIRVANKRGDYDWRKCPECKGGGLKLATVKH